MLKSVLLLYFPRGTQHFTSHGSGHKLTFLTRMVRPWYLKGLENSMYWARSLFIVSGATIMSARPPRSSPIIPFHSFLLLLFTWGPNRRERISCYCQCPHLWMFTDIWGLSENRRDVLQVQGENRVELLVPAVHSFCRKRKLNYALTLTMVLGLFLFNVKSMYLLSQYLD